MHEMSLATNLIQLLRDEMKKHGATMLHEVRICYGPLNNIVPESLEFAFTAIVEETPWKDAKITLHQIPLRLSCSMCETEFTPESPEKGYFSPCPACGDDFGHNVLQGKELYLDSIEVT